MQPKNSISKKHDRNSYYDDFLTLSVKNISITTTMSKANSNPESSSTSPITSGSSFSGSIGSRSSNTIKKDELEEKYKNKFSVNQTVTKIDYGENVLASTRGHIAMNLLETEGSYINQLIFFLEIYGEKLKETINPNLIANYVWNLIVFQIPEIIFSHESFYYILKSKIENFEEENTTFGDVFTQNLNKPFLLTSYARFLENYDVAKEYLVSSNFLKILKNLPIEHPQKLKATDILIAPVQRIPRYLLYIKDMIAKTPHTHKDFSLLKEAEGVVSKLANELNTYDNQKSCARYENCENIYHQIIQSVIIETEKLKEINRSFVNWFNVTYISINEDNSLSFNYEVLLFMFNDMLLFAKPKAFYPVFQYKKPVAYKELELKNRAYDCLEIINFNTAEILKLPEYVSDGDVEKNNSVTLVDILTSLKIKKGIENSANPAFNPNNVVLISDKLENFNSNRFSIVIFDIVTPKSDWPKLIKETVYKHKIGDAYNKITHRDTFEINGVNQPLKFIGASDFSFNDLNSSANMLTFLTDDCVTYSNIFMMAPKIKNVATLLLFNEKCHCFLVAPGTCYLNEPLSINPEIEDLDKENSIETDTNILEQKKNIFSSQEIIIISADREECQQILDEQYIGLESCMWFVSTTGILYVLPSSKNILNQNKIFKFKLGSMIRVMKHTTKNILIGLENGELVIFKHKLHKWNLNRCKRRVVFESDQSPITKIECFSRNLICCVSGKTVALMDKSYNIQNSFKIQTIDENDEISFLSCKGPFFWIATKTSTVIQCYEVNEPFKRVSSIDMRNDVAKFLSDKCNGEIISLHKIKGLRITCLNETEKYVWIGTSAGMVLVIVKLLDQNKNLILPMRTTVLPNGHVGAVRFINIVKIPKSLKNENDEDDELLISKRRIQNSLENFLIVSGGEGYHDYSLSLLRPDLDVRSYGLKDNICTLLTWSIVS